MADAVLINKADGDNRLRAEQAKLEQQNAPALSVGIEPGWTTEVGLCSGLTGEGIPEAWQLINVFFNALNLPV
jgi:LAO/AO transport system kinase